MSTRTILIILAAWYLYQEREKLKRALGAPPSTAEAIEEFTQAYSTAHGY